MMLKIAKRGCEREQDEKRGEEKRSDPKTRKKN
jgi:hypothetical protein